MKKYNEAFILSRKIENKCEQLELVIKTNWEWRLVSNIARDILIDNIKELRETRITRAAMRELLLKLA